jgi:hypothetical protein
MPDRKENNRQHPRPSTRRYLTAAHRVHHQHLSGTKRYASLSFFLRKMSALIKKLMKYKTKKQATKSNTLNKMAPEIVS